MSKHTPTGAPSIHDLPFGASAEVKDAYVAGHKRGYEKGCNAHALQALEEWRGQDTGTHTYVIEAPCTTPLSIDENFHVRLYVRGVVGHGAAPTLADAATQALVRAGEDTDE